MIRDKEKHIKAAYKELLDKGANEEVLLEARNEVMKDFCGNMLVGILGRLRQSRYKYYTTRDYDEAMEMSAQPNCVSTQIANSCGRDAWHLTM
eukprot:5470716-Pleurochrysis_carterae.AAC.1